MNAPFQPETISLDQLRVGARASVTSIDWASLEAAEASRLRHFGFDEGVAVEPLHLGPGEYFVLGDNSSDSRDSRMFGAVRAEQIVGRPVLAVWPWARRRILGGVEPR